MPATFPLAAKLPPCEAIPAVAADGARADVLLQRPAQATTRLLYWVPALGVAAKHYLPLAQALAARGVTVAIHEWRGIGSSDRRASRRQDWGYRELLVDDLPAGIAVARAHVAQAPLYLGGHSLGAQIAVLYAALHPREPAGLLAVASGAPYWRQFPQGRLLWLAYALAPWLARAFGYLPGRRIGFGGNEARRLIDDWARTGRTGRYAAMGMAADVEALLQQLRLPVLALRLQDDWLAPQTSLSWLLEKMPQGEAVQQVVTAADLGADKADHFGWMKTPGPVATRVADWLDAQATQKST
ncbi:alpha/beta hydrolase family protein [Dyella telluris]|uniref:Alpha/beta fold hydrolase n=1 Tax=Dyella telluris TaxID=2763498 RepID=A0A7G8Q6E3_9GAMM|nr:alpha/beta fold hydrolase [Dyella telluris]QNK02351.1 alpha/beta fold hydrolase [Dyella telluris]